jgi:hypothetical protein
MGWSPGAGVLLEEGMKNKLEVGGVYATVEITLYDASTSSYMAILAYGEDDLIRIQCWSKDRNGDSQTMVVDRGLLIGSIQMAADACGETVERIEVKA